jgi:hypothetical protein
VNEKMTPETLTVDGAASTPAAATAGTTLSSLSAMAISTPTSLVPVPSNTAAPIEPTQLPQENTPIQQSNDMNTAQMDGLGDNRPTERYFLMRCKTLAEIEQASRTVRTPCCGEKRASTLRLGLAYGLPTLLIFIHFFFACTFST